MYKLHPYCKQTSPETLFRICSEKFNPSHDIFGVLQDFSAGPTRHKENETWLFSTTNLGYECPHQFPNDLRLLGSQENSEY